VRRVSFPRAHQWGSFREVKAAEKRRVSQALYLGSALITVAFMGLAALAKYNFDHSSAGKRSRAVAQINTNSLPREVMAGLLKDLTGAELPAEAAEVYGRKASLFTTVIELRFSCPEQAFKRMQITSQHLAISLNPTNTIALGGGNLVWWKPEELADVRYGTKQWTLGTDQVSCDLLTGQAKESTNITAYMRLILERIPK
jgi:hypothetical protein